MTQPPPGMPPAFGTGPVVGPEVTPNTIAEAEKLVQVEYTPAERAEAAGNWRVSIGRCGRGADGAGHGNRDA